MSETLLTSLHQAREQIASIYEYAEAPELRNLEQPHSSEYAERLDLNEEVTRGAMWDAAEAEQRAAEEELRAQAVSHEKQLMQTAERMTDEQIHEYFAQLTVNQAAIRSSFMLAA